MSENEQFLQRVAAGNILQALADARAGSAPGAAPLLTLNRALYGAGSEAEHNTLREEESRLLGRLGQAQGAEREALLYNLGCIALSDDEILDARMRFAEVLRHNPRHVMAQHNLGYACELLAELDSARSEYEKVLTLKPDCTLTRLNLAQLRLLTGDADGAVVELDALHAADPDNVGLLLYRCRARLARGHEEDLEQVVQLLDGRTVTEQFPDLRECLGYALHRLGDLEAAERTFAVLLEHQAENAFALVGMIKVLAAQGRTDELGPYVERHRRIDPDDPDMAGVHEALRGDSA